MCIFHVSLEAIRSVLLIFSRLHYSIFSFLIIPVSFDFVTGFLYNLGECVCVGRFSASVWVTFPLMNTYDTNAGRNL